MNPRGQTLIVTSGVGRTRCEGEEIVEIRAGDIIWCPPGHGHRDGAAPGHAMTHVAIHEAEDGRAVEFGDQATDEERRKGPPTASSRR